MSLDAPLRCARCGAALSAVGEVSICAACLLEEAAAVGVAEDKEESAPSLEAGDQLGPYEIIAPIGAGGMGRVYRARDSRIGRDVAVKILPAEVSRDPERVQRFEQEAQAAGRLSHPNIVVVHDVGTVPEPLPDAGAPYLVTEFLEGQTLRDRLNGPRMAPRDALDLARQITAGLAAAHDQGIVHRDLKPENVFITTDGRAKILDFGLAKVVAPDAEGQRGALTEAGVIMGTAGYMSPEQARGQPVDHRSDLFAFGVMVYEMLTGRAPFRRETRADTLNAILSEDPPPMATGSGRPVAPALDRAVRRCLEKDPARRFQSARDLAFSLEVALDAGSGPVTEPARSRSLARWAVAGAIIAAVAAAAWALWPRLSDGTPGTSAPAVARITPFLTTDAVESQPAWSPTGNLIAYVSDAAGNEDIWICDPSGANPINLTADWPGPDALPAWSPDGDRVTFISARDGPGIYTISALGGPVRKRQDAEDVTGLQWAADGSIIVSGRIDDDQAQIYRLPPDEGAPECLTCELAGIPLVRDGALSPSGRLLLFQSRETGGAARVFVANLASGEIHVVADRGDRPQWSGDAEIIFVSRRQGRGELWSVAVDPRTGAARGDPVQTTSGLDASSVAVGPDGRRLLADTRAYIGNLWTFPVERPRIDSLSQGRQLTTGDFDDGWPAWTSDGDAVVFESNRRGPYGVWSIDAAGGAPQLVLVRDENAIFPDPSPDGRWIAVDFMSAESPGLGFTHLIRPDGGGIRSVDPTWPARYRSVGVPNWSPAGDKLAVMAIGAAEPRLVVLDLDAAAMVRTAVELPVPGHEPRWSPDGRFIAFAAHGERTAGSPATAWDVWIVDGEGRNPRQVTAWPGMERGFGWRAGPPLTLFFVRDYREIWVVTIGDDGVPAGPARPWFQVPGVRLGTRVDVDLQGERLVVPITRNRDDLWLVQR